MACPGRISEISISGEAVLIVEASDGENVVTDSVTVELADLQPPEVEILSPSSGQIFNLGTIINFEGSVDDNVEIVDLLIASRRRHCDDLKLRLDYYERTLARARTRSRSSDAGTGKSLAKGPPAPARRAGLHTIRGW